jgi:hypothetical protein
MATTALFMFLLLSAVASGTVNAAVDWGSLTSSQLAELPASEFSDITAQQVSSIKSDVCDRMTLILVFFFFFRSLVHVHVVLTGLSRV